jgi:hypothetical protein
MSSDILAQIGPYKPWLIIAGVFLLFILLRLTRKGLRRRVDEVGYRLFRERGLLIWFWLNAPGVILHELSHALVVVFFAPFGFRITSVTLFRIKPLAQRASNGRVVKSKGPQSLQLGEVQYVRPQGRFMSHIGDGLSGIAPLFGGIAMLTFLYWVATGYNLWTAAPLAACPSHSSSLCLQILRPDWPWWTLLFAPYLILTVTSELWPSSQDWRGARWFVISFILLISGIIGLLWYTGYSNTMLQVATSVSFRIDIALVILFLLDLCFLIIAEVLVQLMRR